MEEGRLVLNKDSVGRRTWKCPCKIGQVEIGLKTNEWNSEHVRTSTNERHAFWISSDGWFFFFFYYRSRLPYELLRIVSSFLNYWTLLAEGVERRHSDATLCSPSTVRYSAFVSNLTNEKRVNGKFLRRVWFRGRFAVVVEINKLTDSTVCWAKTHVATREASGGRVET